MSHSPTTSDHKTVRERVESLLPNWQAWYPSLFDAACDLGLLRARICDLSSLLLSQRHASVQGEALHAFRQQWLVEEPEELDGTDGASQPSHATNKPLAKRPQRRR